MDETWHVGLRPEKTKPCTFTAKSRNQFRREREKWVAEALFFVTCRSTTSTTFLGSIFAKLSTNMCPCGGLRHMVSHSRKVSSIKGSNFPKKTSFYGTKGYWSTHGKRSATPRLFPSPGGHDDSQTNRQTDKEPINMINYSIFNPTVGICTVLFMMTY